SQPVLIAQTRLPPSNGKSHDARGLRQQPPRRRDQAKDGRHTPCQRHKRPTQLASAHQTGEVRQTGSVRPPPFCRESLVAIARGPTPDPIPNSAVKTLRADGTAAQAAEE